MKHVAFAVLLVVLSLTTGCIFVTCPVNKHAHTNVVDGRYQITSDGQGRFMKIDTQTGNTWLLAQRYPTGNSWINMK